MAAISALMVVCDETRHLREALRREKREIALERGVQGIVSRYPIELDSGLRGRASATDRP
jgi:hypothetical protein